eukprot:GHVH01003933.1.p1 GENE.GHVH01003933.1~~GHVH01003933.1.p1  ORF type:complete len:219 (+),score=66.59 GHVH01003933.1:165-821(+)
MSQPVVAWSQNKDTVWVTFEIRDVADLKVDLQADSLEVTCKGNMGIQYKSKITFFAEIVPEESKYATNRSLVFSIHKKEASESGDSWPRLMSEKKKVSWLKVDWSRFEDSDAEEAAAPDGMDWNGMGGGMGGMGGGMPGMGGRGGMGGMGGGMPGMGGMGDMSQLLSGMGGGMPGGDGNFDMAKMEEMMAQMGLDKNAADGDDEMPDLESPEEDAAQE